MDSDKKKTNENIEILQRILGIEEESPKDSEAERELFSILFSVDEENIVDVIIEWPEVISDKLVDSAATLLFSVDKAQVQELIIQALTNSLSSKEKGIPEASNKAMTLWADYEQKFKSKPCVSPKDVLKIKR